MSEQNCLVDLARQVAVLEERMETMNERYDKGWELLRSSMREDSALLREDMAKRDAELAKRDAELARRDTTNTRWLVGVIIAASAIIIAFVLSSN